MRPEQQFFNSIAHKWDDTRICDDKKIEKLVNMADIGEGDSVLDAGCGTGTLLPFLKKAVQDSGQITALDFAELMIERAKEKNRHLTGISYVVGDIESFTTDTPFDKIVCLNFFPHIADKPAFVQKMKTLLKQGGSLVIMHDISRKAVNSIHRGCSAVQKDVLAESEFVCALLAELGYTIAGTLENDELYFIKAVKTN